MTIYEEALHYKNQAITNGADVTDKKAAVHVEIAQALLALVVCRYKHALTSLISATSIVAELAGVAIKIERAAKPAEKNGQTEGT